MNFAGKVLYANGMAASDVHVRIYDRDAPGKGDDDLTISEGVSDDDGGFTIQYEPSRYLDSVEIGSPAADQHAALLPDLLDVYQPYLEFRYTHRGLPRRQETQLLPLVRAFRLPVVPAPVEPFRPSQHGFRFANWFRGYPLPLTIFDQLDISGVPKDYGLCGGMSAAACDFYLAGRSIPTDLDAPTKRKSLYHYLYRRQLDTFGPLGEYVARFYRWMAFSDDTLRGTQRRTRDEFAQARARLDDGMPVVLGLVYVSLNETAEMWKNHQVLACAYEHVSSATTRLRVYDPNCPQADDVWIDAEQVIVGKELTSGLEPQEVTVYGLRCTQRTPDQQDLIPVRGFFVMPCIPVLPPARL